MSNTDNTLADLHTRLSVLEERTQPKPKSLVERVTAWGGVATFLLAFLYTFPLGVWEKFWVSPVVEERTLIVKLTDIDTEWIKGTQSLPADQRTALSLSIRSKKASLLEANIDLIKRHKGALSSQELELLAYQASSIYMVDLASALYNEALKKAVAAGNKYAEAEIYRMQAALASMQDTATSSESARKLYLQAMTIFLTLPPAQTDYVVATMAVEWAGLEHLAGSRACAAALAGWGIALMTPMDEGLAANWLDQMKKANNGTIPPPSDCADQSLLAIANASRPKLTTVTPASAPATMVAPTTAAAPTPR